MSKTIPVWEIELQLGDTTVTVLTTTEQSKVYYGGDWSESVEPIGYLNLPKEQQ